jgi:hypothetical protein
MRSIIKAGAALAILFTTSCKKFLEERTVSDISYSHYETPQGIESGVAAAYDPIRYQFETELTASLCEMGTDMYWDGRDAAYRTQLNRYEATLNSTFADLYDYWSNLYRGVTRCNTILDAIGKIGTGMTESLKKTRTGELAFLRANYNFQLVQTFGKVPLVTMPNLGVETNFPRASIADVYKQIISDLQVASGNLPASQTDYGRATQGAAWHMLALVYLTRGSAVTDQRGQQTTDMDSAAYYADQVINSKRYQLLSNFKDLWDINNQKNTEVIFSAQFSKTQLYNNNNGNRLHLYWGMTYDLKPGMTRTIQYDRPWNRLRPTDFTILHLYDRKNDSRFYKSYQTIWLCNNAASIPKWTAKAGFVPAPELAGKPKFAFGDTSIWVTAEKYPAGTNLDSLYASRSYYYMPMNRQDNANFFVLSKHLDPTRLGFNDEIGFRDGVLYRLGETYLIAAEAYGRKGDFATAADRLNVIRKRAAYKDGEVKPKEYWAVEGGDYADRTTSTESLMTVTAQDLADQPSFVDFMLDERGRELNGELKRWYDLTRTEKLVERVKLYNTGAAANIREYHKYRPIPQNHIDRLDPKGPIEEEQNEGYY